MSSELLNKLRMQKKFKNLKSIQKLLENGTQLEEYLTGQVQPLTENNENGLSTGVIHVNRDLHYLYETDPSNNSTRVMEIRSGDISLSATIQENFFYQHIFNLSLVVILLLQVIVVWAFIWCRLSKYRNSQQVTEAQGEDGIALRDIGPLPEVIPHRDHYGGNRDAYDGNDEGAALADRCGRYG